MGSPLTMASHGSSALYSTNPSSTLYSSWHRQAPTVSSSRRISKPPFGKSASVHSIGTYSSSLGVGNTTSTCSSPSAYAHHLVSTICSQKVSIGLLITHSTGFSPITSTTSLEYSRPVLTSLRNPQNSTESAPTLASPANQVKTKWAHGSTTSDSRSTQSP